MIESKALHTHYKNNLLYFSFPHFDKTELVKHALSSRLGGVSSEPFDSLNLSFDVGDKVHNVEKNYDIFFKAVGLSIKNAVLSHQTHSTNIRCVTLEDFGKGFSKERDFSSIDGLVTNVPGITLVTLCADCVTLCFLDPVKKVIGLAHAGWKGSLNQIGKKTVEVFISKYQSNPSDILVGISPSIGPCCFEVNRDIYNQFMNLGLCGITDCAKPQKNQQFLLNLWKINELILLDSGISETNIITTDICTNCNNQVLFSYRKDGGTTGRMAAVIELRKD